jgi:hypothetical protein
VRWYTGEGVYQQQTIGTADDAIESGGKTVFDFAEALANARKIVTERRADAMASAAGPPITVRSAMEEYTAARERRETQQGPAKRDARSRLTKHVLGDKEIADLALHKLTEASIAGWRDRLPESLATTSIRRTANDFRAALNLVARRHRAHLPPHISVVIKNGFAAEERGAAGTAARPAQILTDADVRRIVAAAHKVDDEQEMAGDLARLVILLSRNGSTILASHPSHRQRCAVSSAAHHGAGIAKGDRCQARQPDRRSHRRRGLDRLAIRNGRPPRN